MMKMPYTSMFRVDWLEPVSCFVQTFSCCLLAIFIALRFPIISEIKSIGGAKITILLVLCNSFIFSFVAVQLSFGLGTSQSMPTCSAASWICLLLYSSGKYITTLFLCELFLLFFVKFQN